MWNLVIAQMIKPTFNLAVLLLFGFLSLTNTQAQESSDPVLKPITLQLQWKHQFEFAGFYAAKAKGFYQQAGLDVNILPYTPGDEAPVNKLISGAADFAVGDSTIIIDRAKGAPIKLLANIFQHSPFVLLTLSDSGIISPAQMVGKKIMLAKHEEANAEFESMFAVESVSLDQLQVVEHSFTLDPLLNGEVDIISAYASNEPGILQQMGVKFNLIKPINYGIDFYGNNLYTSESMLQNNQALVHAFVNASLQGWQYALDHQEEIIDLILSQYTQDKTRAALLYEANAIYQFVLPKNIPLGEVNEKRMQRIVDTYQQLNLIPADFNLKKLLANTLTLTQELKFSHAEKQWLMQNHSIVIGVDPSWAPFEFIDAKGNYSGMASDFIKLIAQKTGLTFEVQKNATWKDVIQSAKLGKLDVLPAASRSPQREEFLDFTTPHMSYPMVILTNKDSHIISQLEDLKNRDVVVIDGYVTEDLLRNNHPDINLIEARDMNHALDILSSKDADAFIDNLASITFSINQRGISNLRISGTTPYEFTLGLAVVKDKPQLFNIMQKAVNSISEAENRAIRDKWISLSIEPALPMETIIEIAVVISVFIIMMAFWNRKLSAEVARRKIYETELASKEKRFRELFENNKAPELIIDPVQGKIIDANNSALVYYGYSRAEITALKISDINTLTQQEVLREMVNATKENRAHYYFKHRLANGEIRDVEVHSGPINWDGKQLNYSIIHDITARIVAENALISAKAEAEQATRIKSEFLANMSHEIRTPMNSVIGMTELMLETPLNKDQQKMLSIIQSSGKNLIMIINDILDFSKLEADKMVMDIQPFLLLPFIQEVIETLQPSALEKSLELSLHIDDNCNILIYSDQTRLRQILTNLLSNAIKFTLKGEVSIRVSMQPIDARQASFIFSVTDTGIGLDKEILEHIFDSFTQAEQSTTRKFGGTGLGLAISKKLSVLMGGDIKVESSPGVGSSFTLSIPSNYEVLRLQEIKQHRKQPQPDSIRNQFDARILVAEDVLPNRILIAKMLQKFGINCDFAENGQEAIDKFKHNHYDLVLMDCQMPVMDGYTATQQIRLIDKSIPIIALTANVTTEDNQKALAAGMDDVITKPLQIATLGHFLNRWLIKYITDATSGIPQTEQQTNAVSVLNFEQLEKFKCDMEEAFEEVYQAILSTIPSLIDELEAGPQDKETVIRLFHSLKTPAASLGAYQLSELAAEYELMARNTESPDLTQSVKELRIQFNAMQRELKKYPINA